MTKRPENKLFKKQEDVRELWNNTTPAIIIPPSKLKPHQSWTALVLSEVNPGRIYFGTRCLPGKIGASHIEEIRKEDSIHGYLVQITNADQYVYLRSNAGKPLVFTVFSGETSMFQDLTNKKEIIKPGEELKLKLGIPLYLTEITFSMHEIKDHEVIDRVVNTVWK